MKHFSICLLSLLLLTHMYVNAQSNEDLEHNAPSLQIGLDGLAFSRGTPDAQLIMEIIAEKQREIKLKIVQNMFLGKLQNTGGAVYAYADNILRTVLEEKEQTTRAKLVMESTVNMVFVYAFAEYYVRQLQNNPDSIKAAFADVAKHYGINDTSGIRSLRDLRAKPNQSRTDPAGSAGGYESLEDNSTSMLALVLDMASEVVRENESLKDLGVMRISYSATYEYLNEYKNARANPEMKAIVSPAGKLYTDMKSKMKSIAGVIGLLSYVTNQFTFRYNQLDVASPEALAGMSNALAGSRADFDAAIRKLGQITQAISQNRDTIYKNDISQLIRIKTYLEKAQKFLQAYGGNFSGKESTVSDIIYTIQSDFTPLLTKMAFIDPAVTNLITSLTGQNEILAGKIISTLEGFQSFNEKILPLFRLVSRLYEFNKATTFSEYIKLVNDLEEVFPDEKIKDAISKINSFVKDYAVIKTNDNGREVLDFNVESFLVKLENMKKYRYRQWEFLLTVGASSGFFTKELIMKGDTLNSFSFVSEKIGIKYKIWDFDWMTRNPGETYRVRKYEYTKVTSPKEPIVSDIHALLYGSGLLYNILNTGNSSVFKAPLVGTGLGITFVNALDLNLTASIPIFSDRSFKSSFDYPLLSLNFDIRFTEYLNRLQKKREANRNQKNLAKAAE